jgi:RHS repeat-associated protein
MKAKGLLAGIGVVLAILGCARQSAAQATPGVFADANHPAGAPDPEKLDQIWQVDPVTGSVSITIPFSTTPQGGRGPKIPFTLHYNSSSTVTFQPVGSTTMLNAAYLALPGGGGVVPAVVEQYYAWVTGTTAPTFAPVGPWTTSGPFIYDSQSTLQNQSYTYTISGNNQANTPVYQGCSIYGPYIYTDASGAAHDMNLLTTQLSQAATAGYDIPYTFPQCSTAYSQSSWNSETSDGSALMTSSGTSNAVVQSSIVQPDGTKFTSDSTLEDSNGNTATFGTDSLGRTTFSTNIPIGVAGQIPVGNYTVTTTGATGSTETYTVNFVTATIGSFTMPHPVGGAVGTSEILNQGYCIASITCPTNYSVWPPSSGKVNGGTTLPVVNSIQLPDLTSYTFTYDPTYGTISKIGFPTGGYVRFVWQIRGDGGVNNVGSIKNLSKLSTIVVSEVCTSTGSGGENCWQYSFPDYSSTTGLTSTVTAPDGSTTSYTGVQMQYSGIPMFNSGSAASWKEASRLEYSSSGTLMKSVQTIYSGVGSVGLTLQAATTLWDGPTPLQQVVQYLYDSYANVIEKDESDFSSCTAPCTPPVWPAAPTAGWLRRTFTNYDYMINAATTPLTYIVDKPSQVLVTDGNGHPYSLTLYGYDETPVTNSTGIVNHDYTNYPASFNVRGNLTSEQHCSVLNNTATVTSANAVSACASWLKTTHTYDLTGQVLSTTDPAGNTTTFSYADNYASEPGVSPPPLTNGYPTSVTHPDGTLESYSYYYNTGQPASHSDVNSQVTSYTYSDSMNRVTKITLPATSDGTLQSPASKTSGWTSYTYSDTSGAFSVQEQHLVDSGGTTTSVTKTYDGLGRAVQTATAVPTTQCSGGTLLTQTTYDSMSRVASTTNPYCTTSDPTYGLTYFAYDGLGRKIQTTLPDGAVSTILYAGNATETTDPPNGTTSVQHIQQSNGLGFLTSVCEVGLAPLSTGGPQSCNLNIAGAGSLTTYTYDPLGNMRSVNQHGLTRAFTYDGLSRLLTALNPEVGLDSYTYLNSNGTVPSPGDVSSPITRTDARGVQTNYAYDSMSRLTSKSYSAASGNTTGGVSDLTSCYLYGTAKASYTVGRLIAEWMQQPGTCGSSAPTTAVGVRYHSSYDAMGRVLADQQCLTGATCSATTGNFVYSYNLLGSPVQSNNGIFASTVGATQTATQNATPITAPSITWKTTYDVAGHINYVGVQDQPSTSVFPTAAYSFAPTLLNPTSYDPFSHLTGAQVGIPYGSSTQAINILRQYDNRGRIMNETDGGLVDASSATGSMGVITVGGAEKARYSSYATPGTATLTVAGTDGSGTVCVWITNQYTTYQTCNTVSDNGTLSVTINGFTSSATYSSNIADGSLAATLIAGFNAAGSPVTAVVNINNPNTFTVTAKTTGPSSDYPVSISSSYYVPNSSGGTVTTNTNDTYGLTGSTTLSGGHQGGCMAYDTGTVTAQIANASGYTPFSYVASASWAQSDTAATVAAKLASSINSVAGSVVTATPDTANASYIDLYSKSTGAAADFNISVSVNDTMGVLYSYLQAYPSFSLDAETMTGGAGADASYGTIYSYEAGYAPNGNILTHNDSVMGTWNFTYDSQDRLATAVAGPSAPSAFRNQSAAWSYDSYGNRTAQTFTNNVYSNWATYNSANNHIATASTAPGGYTYDASGNTLYDGNNKYWYDAEGQLCAQQNQVSGIVTQYVYDAEGARIAKTTLSAAPANATSLCAQPLSSGYTLTARYLVDLGGDQVTEINGAGQWQHSNVFSAARLTATYDYNNGNGGLHYELADPLGTKRVQANISGQIEESCISLPFGDALSCTGSDDATEHHFTQKERDAESNNDYFFARYYNSAIGRFTTPDWSAKVVPVPYAQMGDPQSLNLYAYVRNNPITGMDTDGHIDCSGKNANGIGCQYMAARQWIASAGLAAGATLGETFKMAANITGAVLAQQQYADKNTNVMLYAGIPPQPSQPGVQSVMDYQIVPAANTVKELNQKMHPWSHKDVVAYNDLQKLGTKIWESIGGGPEGWQQNVFLRGGGHDNLSMFDGSVRQKWYVGSDENSLKRVQVVVSADNNGNLIKAWTVGITFNASGPVFSKIE